jgi:GNAT superfamily N-acetyltransferase
MRVVDLDSVSESYWEELAAGEPEPFGGVGGTLTWREKTRNIGIREDDGRLVAAAGAVLAEVEVGQEPPFQVVGLGGLIVTRTARGRGLARVLSVRLLEIAREFEVKRAMLFCMPELMSRYEELGFAPIDAPVWVDQPGGRVEMPMRAMWASLGEGVGWPPGRVELVGEPF